MSGNFYPFKGYIKPFSRQQKCHFTFASAASTASCSQNLCDVCDLLCSHSKEIVKRTKCIASCLNLNMSDSDMSKLLNVEDEEVALGSETFPQKDGKALKREHQLSDEKLRSPHNSTPPSQAGKDQVSATMRTAANRAPSNNHSQHTSGQSQHVNSTGDDAVDDESGNSIFRMLAQDDANEDLFLYFSSDKRRLEYLLGRELPHMPMDVPVKRKKRISFELDPFYDLLDHLNDFSHQSDCLLVRNQQSQETSYLLLKEVEDQFSS